jgi:hypothetical protein
MLPAKFFEIFRLLLFFAATTFVVPAQTPTETHSKIRRAVENKEYAEASGFKDWQAVTKNSSN